MMFQVLFLVAALSAAPAEAMSLAVPQAEVRNVRITLPKLQVVRAKSDSEVFVAGQIRVDMSFSKKFVHNPVLRLACLCETDGRLTVHTVFLDKLLTSEGMRRSDIQAALKASGKELSKLSQGEREAALTDPAAFTPYLPEVSQSVFGVAVYGAPGDKRGYFRLGRCQTMPKVLLAHAELWQNGVRAAARESQRTGLGAYEIPKDWYLWKKYPQKFRYADIR